MKKNFLTRNIVILTIMVLLILIVGCATSSNLQPEIISDTGAIDTLEEQEQEETPFQASMKMGLLDTSETEKIFDQPFSEIVDSDTEAALDSGESITPSEAPSILAPMEQAPEMPDLLIQPQLMNVVATETEPVVPIKAPKSNNLTITAIGSGLSEAEAKSDALSALSGILHSQVVSSIEIREKVSEVNGIEVGNVSSFAEDIVVSTSLPILGASFSAVPRTSYDRIRKTTVYQVDVVMKASASLPLYEGELNALAFRINKAEESLPSDTDSLVLEERLSLLLGYYTQYEKLSYVARTLGLEQIPDLKQSRYSIESQLKELGRVNDSYEKAAQNLTKTVDVRSVYVYPAKLNASGGVTEFAEQLSYAMRSALGSQTVSDPLRASYFLLGTYTLKDDGKDGIYVTYRLEDRYGNVVSTSMVELLPSVYKGQRFIPVAYDFQKQLERGDSIDTGFSADIRINGKKDYLTFQGGEQLTIEVRSSAPCYFYVVGYVFNDRDERFSYLFPLKLDAVGKDMFVYRVSPEDVNKWIIINPTYAGKILPIEVIEPYGVEMLQVYASTEKDYQRFLDTVPGLRETKDYYVVSDNPEDGLKLTRALNIKKVADQVADEIQRSEASVSFKSGK